MSMRPIHAAALTLCVAAALAGPAVAGDDVGRAKAIVAEHCSRCHEVPGFDNPRRDALVKAPRFRDLAAAPEVYTEVRLREYLRQPHYPMRSIILSARDIASLVAFIRGLPQD